MELLILPFFIPLILIGRVIDVVRQWRGETPSGQALRGWAESWGKLLPASESSGPNGGKQADDAQPGTYAS